MASRCTRLGGRKRHLWTTTRLIDRRQLIGSTTIGTTTQRYTQFLNDLLPLQNSISSLSSSSSSYSQFSTVTNTKRHNSTTSTTTTTSQQQQQQQKPSSYIDGPDTHFGFESVKIEEKEGRVREVFENVADSYDIMNDLMSGGLHRYWKDVLLEQSAVGPMATAIRQLELVNVQERQNEDVKEGSTLQSTNNHIPTLSILDVAGGTGDIAFRFVEAAGCPERSTLNNTNATSDRPDPVSVTVCDINAEMLRVGRARAVERYGERLVKNGIGGGLREDNMVEDMDAASTNDDDDDNACALSFVQGNAQDLSNFDDNTFDLYTIAFGLRNVTDVDKGLAEAYRVLKPGGRFMCLEFSQVPDPILRQIYDTYSFSVIPEMGHFVANDRDSYQYLVESIRKFSNQEELIRRMEAVGFQLCKYTNLTGGIVAIHEGWKPV